MTPANPPRAFVSYSHDSAEHVNAVRRVADMLRHQGVDCRMDLYETVPPKGWPAWMQEQIMESDFVIVVCTETYADRLSARSPEGVGLGVAWEGLLISQEVYEA